MALRFWIVSCLAAALLVGFAGCNVDGRNHPRHWRNAKVVALETRGLLRHFDVIDSYDPDCIVSAVEIRNPFRPLSIKKGATVQVAMLPPGHIYLRDEHGREHDGTILSFALMPKRIPTQK